MLWMELRSSKDKRVLTYMCMGVTSSSRHFCSRIWLTNFGYEYSQSPLAQASACLGKGPFQSLLAYRKLKLRRPESLSLPISELEKYKQARSEKRICLQRKV